MKTFRFWYYGAYVDILATSEEDARERLGGLATIVHGHQFACVPITSDCKVEELQDT